MKPYPFENPSDKFRGLDLWMVNDKLEDHEIIAQVKSFREKGLYSVIFRTYNGIISDYPGPEFKHKVRVAVDAAKECGLKIALQAGFMPSAFPCLPQEFALHRLVPVPESSVNRNHVVLCRYNGIAFTDQIAAATVNMLNADAVNYYIQTAYEDMWSDFSDEFGKTITSVWLDEPRFDNRLLTWSPDFEEIFFKRYGYGICENLHSLYYDVGNYKKIRYDYFTFLRHLMETNYFTSVRNWCHKNNLSFSGHLMGEELLTTQIAQAVACMPFYKYFDIPGVDMLCYCHDWYDRPHLPDVPLRERVTRSMHVSAIQCTSAAEQAGKELKLCEMYGVTSPGLVFRDQMHLFDFFAANGINHQCIHALFYSPRGFRKRFYPQSFNTYQPFWDNFKNIKDYVAAVSHYTSMGKSGNDVVVLHPLETAYGLFRGLIDPQDTSNRAIVEDYDKKFYRLIVDLYSSQVGFHFVDSPTLDNTGSTDNNLLQVGSMSYGKLVIADIEVITEKALKLITEFANNGGQIYIKGELPSRLDGEAAPQIADIIKALPSVRIFHSNEDLIRALKNDTTKTWHYFCDTDSSHTVINHRIEKDNHYFFIHNGDCQKEKHGFLSLKGNHKAFLFDGVTRSITEMCTKFEDGNTVIDFTNPIGASTMIFTAPRTQDEPHTGIPSTIISKIPIRNASCNVLGENVLTLETCRYKTDDMECFSENNLFIEHLVEKLKCEQYEGNITLRFTFYSDFCIKDMKLIVEDLSECKIKLNGIDIPSESDDFYYAPAFSIVKLPDAVKIGENVIEITRYTKPQVSLSPSDDMKHLFELFRAPVGIDLERIHLLGNFFVETTPEISSASGLVRIGKKFVITPQKDISRVSDITSHGYPFYPGAIEYTAKVYITEDMLHAKQIYFNIGNYSGCSSSIYLNDELIGSIDREPHKLYLNKEKLISGKENTIKVRMLGTFRNMFGPSHMQNYDCCNCSRGSWLVDFDNNSCTEYDTEKITNSYHLLPYGAGDFSIEFISY